MRFRHAHDYTQREHNAGWDALLARQVRKFANKIDVVNAWSRREFFILEKINGGTFTQQSRLKYGSAWTFAVNLQATRMERIHREVRRERVKPKSYRRVMTAFKKRRYARQNDGPWRMAQLAAVLQASYLRAADDWRKVIWNACRRMKG